MESNRWWEPAIMWNGVINEHESWREQMPICLDFIRHHVLRRLDLTPWFRYFGLRTASQAGPGPGACCCLVYVQPAVCISNSDCDHFPLCDTGERSNTQGKNHLNLSISDIEETPVEHLHHWSRWEAISSHLYRWSHTQGHTLLL